MPTKEEAAYYYRRYSQYYYDARSSRNAAVSRAESCKADKAAAENSLSSCKSQKKNLEARLEDVKEIISLLENSVASRISKANRAAGTAGEKYCRAIKCSSVSSASIESAYRTKTVTEDDDSADTYQSCKNEKARLEASIEELRNQIQALDRKISSLSSSIRSYTNAANNYAGDMRNYQNKANYYAGYL